MTNTLAEVKKLINGVIANGHQIRKIQIQAEEFGEGYNVYCDVMFWADTLKQESFTLVEEEKKSKAVARVKRVKESLEKLVDPSKPMQQPKAYLVDGFLNTTTI